MSSWKSSGRWEERASLFVTDPSGNSSERSRRYQSSMVCWVCSSRTAATLSTAEEAGACVKLSLMGISSLLTSRQLGGIGDPGELKAGHLIVDYPIALHLQSAQKCSALRRSRTGSILRRVRP